jgi:hypothetical protein
LKAIEWFAHCGEPTDFDLTMPVNQVKSWRQAMRTAGSRACPFRLKLGGYLA